MSENKLKMLSLADMDDIVVGHMHEGWWANKYGVVGWLTQLQIITLWNGSVECMRRVESDVALTARGEPINSPNTEEYDGWYWVAMRWWRWYEDRYYGRVARWVQDANDEGLQGVVRGGIYS